MTAFDLQKEKKKSWMSENSQHVYLRVVNNVYRSLSVMGQNI